MAKRFWLHYLAACEGGPLKSQRRVLEQFGHSHVMQTGGEYAVACKRTYLSRLTPSGKAIAERFDCTGVVYLVTCPHCQKSPLYLRDKDKVRPATAGRPPRDRGTVADAKK